VTITIEDVYHPLDEVVIPVQDYGDQVVVIIDTDPKGPDIALINDTNQAPVYDWQSDETNPSDEGGRPIYEPITGTGVNITIQDVNGDEVEKLDLPVTLIYDVPPQFSPEDIYLFMFDRLEQHWVEVSLFYNQSHSPRISCGANRVEFDIQHLTQFNLFYQPNSRSEECYYKDCGDYGFCVCNSCSGDSEIELEDCICMIGHLGENCEQVLTEGMTAWKVLRWVSLVIWLGALIMILMLVINRWLIERSIRSYSHWDLLFKSDWQTCWLIVFGAMFRVIWLAVDPHSQSEMITPEAGYIISGLYLPISLIIHANVFYSWSVGVLNMEGRETEVDTLTMMYSRAKYAGWILLPISITSDTLLSINLNNNIYVVGFILNLLVLVLYVIVNLGLIATGLLYLHKTWKVFMTFYKQGGRHNLLTLIIIVSCNSMLIMAIIIFNVVGGLVDTAQSFITLFMVLEIALMMEWIGLSVVIIRPTSDYDYSNSGSSTSKSKGTNQSSISDRKARRIEAGIEKDTRGSDRRYAKQKARDQARAKKAAESEVDRNEGIDEDHVV